MSLSEKSIVDDIDRIVNVAKSIDVRGISIDFSFIILFREFCYCFVVVYFTVVFSLLCAKIFCFDRIIIQWILRV